MELVLWCTQVAPRVCVCVCDSPTHVESGDSKLCGSSKNSSHHEGIVVESQEQLLMQYLFCWLFNSSQEKTLLTSDDEHLKESYSGLLSLQAIGILILYIG